MAGLHSLSLRYAACAAALATCVIIARAVHRRRSLALANSKAKIALTPVIVRQRSVAQRGWHRARVVLSAIRLAGVRPARIALLLAGSRGDYQGYAQLCKILVKRRLKVEAWCLGEANAEFMRSLGIDARAADVPVGDELFKQRKFKKARALVWCVCCLRYWGPMDRVHQRLVHRACSCV